MKNIYSVKQFWEKPGTEIAGMLFAKGSLINTFVLVGKSSAFINHIQNCIPEIYNAFDPIHRCINSSIESTIAEYAYSKMPLANFSTSVLEKITEHLCVMEVKNVNWSDWGEEQRILCDLNRLNEQKKCQLNTAHEYNQDNSVVSVVKRRKKIKNSIRPSLTVGETCNK